MTGKAASRDADLTVDLIRGRGGTAVADYEDVADFDGAGRMVEHAVDEFGKLDILVNNAGIVRDAMVFNMTEATWDCRHPGAPQGHVRADPSRGEVLA